jgi:hypothetical protein
MSRSRLIGSYIMDLAERAGILCICITGGGISAANLPSLHSGEGIPRVSPPSDVRELQERRRAMTNGPSSSG